MLPSRFLGLFRIGMDRDFSTIVSERTGARTDADGAKARAEPTTQAIKAATRNLHVGWGGGGYISVENVR